MSIERDRSVGAPLEPLIPRISVTRQERNCPVFVASDAFVLVYAHIR